MARCPNGVCAKVRVTVSRSTPSAPHRRHHGSGSITRQSSTTLPGSNLCPTAVRPSSSSRQKVVRSAGWKVAWCMSRSFGWGASELPSSGDLDPSPRHHTAEHFYTLKCEEPTYCGQARTNPSTNSCAKLFGSFTSRVISIFLSCWAPQWPAPIRKLLGRREVAGRPLNCGVVGLVGGDDANLCRCERDPDLFSRVQCRQLLRAHPDEGLAHPDLGLVEAPEIAGRLEDPAVGGFR